jgi:hypothetical protein
MIEFPRLVRVLENRNGWEGIEEGEVYPVHGENLTMISISTKQFPTGAYLMKEWVEFL